MNFKAILFNDSPTSEDYDVDIDDFPEGEEAEEIDENDDDRDEEPEELEVNEHGHFVRGGHHRRKDDEETVLNWDER